MTPAIAIVGMACRFPDAASPHELWQQVLACRRAFRRLPAERLDLADYACADGSAPDTTYSTEAALIEGYAFDRVRYRVTGEAYRSTDAAHWLALDVAAAALADAGFADGDGLPRRDTGVLVGNTLTGEFSRAAVLRLRWPYVRRVLEARLAADGWPAARRADWLDQLEADFKRPFPPVTGETLAGGLSNTIAGRVCNFFDLGGGGFTVDGACSSSLLAVAQACSALAAGDLDAALAGGVDLSLDPFELVGFARLGALARHEMKVYDRDAQGFWPGEGCGFVVLMRDDDARARGLRRYALIRGWGVSSDGAGGLTRPERDGQALALARAYRRAGYGIDQVGYFEGHGTGTPVGDPVEIEALAAARRAADPHAPPAVLGSIKANIGHTKAAAGIAGLIKATLALDAQVLPPASGCEHPHPALAAAADCLRAPRSGAPWPPERALCAGVSAFGFGGINVHVALTGTATTRRQHLSSATRALLASAQDTELLLLGADDHAGLAALAARVLARAPALARAELADLAAALARRGPAAPRARAAVIAATPAELARALQQLLAWLADGRDAALDPAAGVFLGAGARQPRIALLFPGQAAPVRADGGALERRFPTISALYRHGAHTVAIDPPKGKQPAAPTTGAPGSPAISTAIAQPAIVLAELAGLCALARLGVRGDVAVGHSLGELTALHWAGALDVESLLELARVRGAAMAGVPGPPGAMASIATGAADAQTLCDGIDGVVVAALNGPQQSVIAGRAGAVTATIARAQARGLHATRLPVSHAFHSPQMAAAAPALEACARRLGWHPLARRVYSSVTGELLAPDTDPIALLRTQLTAPVLFERAAGAAVAEADLALEVGPGALLSGLLGRGRVPVIALDAGGPHLRGLLAALGAAFALGAAIDREALFARRLVRAFDLDRAPSFFVNPCELAPRAELGAGERPETAGGAGAMATVAAGAPPGPLPDTDTQASPSRSRGPDGAAAGHEKPDAATVLERLRRLVAARTELPPEAVRDDARLLADLHLNSIAVAEIVAELGAALGLAAPLGPSEYAGATLGEIAAALTALADTGGGAPRARADAIAGVDDWVRAYRVAWQAAGALPEHAATMTAAAPSCAGDGTRATGAGGDTWTAFAPAGYRRTGALRAALETLPGSGVAVYLPAGQPRAADRVRLLSAAQCALAPGPAPRRFVLAHHGGPAVAFARSLHLEAPGLTTCVVELPDDAALPARVAAEAAAADGYHEIRYALDGTRTRPVLELAPQQYADSGSCAVRGPIAGPNSEPDPDLPCGPTREPAAGDHLDRVGHGLDAHDVVLVSGGGKGIAAECAAALARRSGARLALLGRADPQHDSELSANLARLAAAGVAFRYQQADVTDADAVRRAVHQAVAALGPITAVVHGAGRNQPVSIGALDAAALERTWVPKVRGLRALLAALDPARLRLLVGFGSIIARTGLRGEADYGLANAALTLAIEDFAQHHPHCRCLSLEWSVWSGAGMGERLGRVDALARDGVAPISVDRGVASFLGVLGGTARGALILCGRIPELPTLRITRPALPLGRFLEHPRVYFPGVELISDAVLSGPADPYLDDHRIGGDRVLPAVLGLEAIAQAAAAVAGEQRVVAFESVHIERPIIVPAHGEETLRIACLVRAPGVVDAVLRCQRSSFVVDHFRARCRLAPGAAAAARDAPGVAHQIPGADVALDPARDLYGALLFHTGRFRRLARYRQLHARACAAEIGPDAGQAWFGHYLPDALWLGDPGARDAALHALQACVPHARLLPVAVAQIAFDDVRASGARVVRAVERWQRGDTYCYDLDLHDAAGRRLESWRGLELHALEAVCPDAGAPALLAAHAERRVGALLPGARLRVALLSDGTQPIATPPLQRAAGCSAAPARSDTARADTDLSRARQTASAQALGMLLEDAARLHRRADGRWELPGCSDALCTAHADRLTLAVAGAAPLACDLETVRARPAPRWEHLLGPCGRALATRVAAETGEPLAQAATRVWAARECLKKSGSAPDTPLTLASVDADGWVVFAAGTLAIASVAATLTDQPSPRVLAVLAGRSDAQL